MATFRKTKGEEAMEKCVLAMEKCILLHIQNKISNMAQFHPADEKFRMGAVVCGSRNKREKKYGTPC
jgi:hypothetical protein